jgi:cardiolipin synthase
MFSRYTISALLILLELALLIYIALEVSAYSVLFLAILLVLNFAVLISVINSPSNPEYRVSWLALVLLVPIIGAIIYVLFRRSKMSKREVSLGEGIMREIEGYGAGAGELDALSEVSSSAASRARAILSADRLARVYSGTRAKYYTLGKDMYLDMLEDIAGAEEYVFLEYFIIEDGVMWRGIHAALVECVLRGVTVRLIYDDIGCMQTLPATFLARLWEEGIEAVRFSPASPRVTASHNNRDHRKICVIDGAVAYTGGVNIADEYIGERIKHGVWKDGGVRVSGDAALGFATLFLLNYDLTARSVSDYGRYISSKVGTKSVSGNGVGVGCDESFNAPSAPEYTISANEFCAASHGTTAINREPDEAWDGGFYIPFGSGPSPMYSRPVGKRAILDIINQAERYAYITTPYLIIDFELTEALIGAVERGVDVRIITPGIADKKIVKIMTKSSYLGLVSHGVKIYEYTPGFIHLKAIVSDDRYAMVGTINLDYRSLEHHFEDALWCYGSPIVAHIKEDIEKTLEVSNFVSVEQARLTFFEWLIKHLLRIFAPLL